MTPKIFGKNDIFKYGGLDDLERTLDNETLGFSRLLDYNDPFESEYSTCLYITDPVKRKSFLDSGFIQAKEKDIWSSIEKLNDWLEFELGKKRVTCFSYSPVEPLMWAHYANKHRGVCYWFDKNVFGEDYKSGEVNYSSQLPKLTVSYRESTSSDI